MDEKRRIPLVGGDEYDVLSKWRKVVRLRAGDAKAIKKKYNKRFRHKQKQALKEMVNE